MDAQLTLEINGTRRSVTGVPERSFLTVLRDELGLTGTKYGCGEAQCGACVVLVEGQPTPACVTPVEAVAGKSIITIEGLAQNGALHPVQEAFLAADAFQCGYCTPGMILATVALLDRHPAPTEAQTIEALQKHLCRCGAYRRILEAVQRAAARQGGSQA